MNYYGRIEVAIENTKWQIYNNVKKCYEYYGFDHFVSFLCSPYLVQGCWPFGSRESSRFEDDEAIERDEKTIGHNSSKVQ